MKIQVGELYYFESKLPAILKILEINNDTGTITYSFYGNRMKEIQIKTIKLSSFL